MALNGSTNRELLRCVRRLSPKSALIRVRANGSGELNRGVGARMIADKLGSDTLCLRFDCRSHRRAEKKADLATHGCETNEKEISHGRVSWQTH
jgi:hypothetical protein